MDLLFVDWNVEFAEIQGAPYPVDVAAQVLYSGEVISRMLVIGAHQQAKEVGEVTMHALQAWVYNCVRDVGYDLVVEPLTRVQGEDALTADGCSWPRCNSSSWWRGSIYGWRWA